MWKICNVIRKTYDNGGIDEIIFVIARAIEEKIWEENK